MFISTQEFGSRTFTHDDPRLFLYGGDKLDPNQIALQRLNDQQKDPVSMKLL
jgi:hypothetical protein